VQIKTAKPRRVRALGFMVSSNLYYQ